MTLTIFTVCLWLFLAALWALVIYGAVCWWRDRYVTVGVDEPDEEDDGGGVGPFDGPNGPIDWDEEFKKLREREIV